VLKRESVLGEIGAGIRALASSLTPTPSARSIVCWQRDIKVIYPIDRLREFAAFGEIGGVADTHYTVMGSTDPAAMDSPDNA
jgi:hypothetical protein